MRDAIVTEKAEDNCSADVRGLPVPAGASQAEYMKSLTTMRGRVGKRPNRVNRTVDYKAADPELAKIGLEYRYPDDPARVLAYLTALVLTQDDMPIEVIAAAFGDSVSSVDRMRQEAVAAAAEAVSVKPEFRIVPYKWLAKIQMGRRPLSKIKRFGATAPLPFASIADMREVFSARRPSVDIGALGQTGLAAVRTALGIKLPVRAYQFSNSATTIRAAIAVVQRNLSDPLVREAVAKWRGLP